MQTNSSPSGLIAAASDIPVQETDVADKERLRWIQRREALSDRE